MSSILATTLSQYSRTMAGCSRTFHPISNPPAAPTKSENGKMLYAMSPSTTATIALFIHLLPFAMVALYVIRRSHQRFHPNQFPERSVDAGGVRPFAVYLAFAPPSEAQVFSYSFQSLRLGALLKSMNLNSCTVTPHPSASFVIVSEISSAKPFA